MRRFSESISLSVVVVIGLAASSRAQTRPLVDSITINSRSGIALEFVHVPPGEYTVGRDVGGGELALRLLGQRGSGLDEGPERVLKLTTGFYLCRHQVTASQFATFLNDVEPDRVDRSIVLNRRSNIVENANGYAAREGADRHPANTVTWDGAVEFTKWCAAKTGWAVRLPSEDEWEAAARTSRGFPIPTGGGEREVDPRTGLLAGIRAGKPDAEVDAFEENVTSNGLFHTLSAVGDWTSDVYESDRGDDLPDALVADYEGGHVLKRCLNSLTEREAGGAIGENGVYGLRVLLEATESGSPKRKPPSE